VIAEKTVPITIYNEHRIVLYPGWVVVEVSDPNPSRSDHSSSGTRDSIVALLENVKDIAEKRGRAAKEAKQATTP